MASRFPAHWLDELRSRSDIVQIISGYVGLKKSGRKYWGLCPFHGEKTASFSVDAEQQLYYCFGCKAGGNVINFIMDIERCSFHEAVELLAERAHIPMPEMENDAEWEKRRTRREISIFCPGKQQPIRKYRILREAKLGAAEGRTGKAAQGCQ